LKRDFPIPEEIDERLHEWAHFFRDRNRLESCKSIEHRYKPHSDDYAAEGWGDKESAPSAAPERSYRLLRALETHEAIGKVQVKYRWAITYAFCYPSLPRFVIIRLMKKWTGRRFTWKEFDEMVDVARYRISALLSVK
jgi:hypothetical protein